MMWRNASFGDSVTGVWPEEWTEREQWMGHTEGDKNPFAPWGDADADVACDNHDEPMSCAECGHDARYKWGYEPNWTDHDEAAKWADMLPQIAGLTFLLDDADNEPFAFVDGDDVRDPETGEVYGGFIAVLEKLGVSYADVSTSGSGVHVVYRGDLPDGVKQAKLQLADEPFGANDDVPVAEIYDHSKVCVATGRHIPETPTDVREWDSEELENLLRAHGVEPGEAEPSDLDLDDFEPDATDADDVTNDPKDIAAAVDRLDARRVADDTIVHRWNDEASTSGNNRAFAPTWGPSANGTANIVDEEIWQDTGGEGYGGPIVMAAISCPDLPHDERTQAGDVSGSEWFTAAEHLRELGFAIPKFLDISDEAGSNDRPSESDETGESAATDGGTDTDSSVSSEPEAPPAPPEEESDDNADDGQTDEEPDEWQEVYQAYAVADNADDRLPARFNATELLDERQHWRSLVENDVLYHYDADAGIYRGDGEQQLRTVLAEELREQFRTVEVREIGEQLRARNMIRQEAMGGPANKIAAKNCVIHVERDEIRTESHDPSHEFLTRVQTEFDAEADCPRFRSFLQEVVQTEADRKKLQEFAGYALHHWGLPHHKALFLVGPTASGKSTFLDTIRAMLGNDAVSSLTPQQMTEQRFAGAELFEKWANIRNDIPSETVKNTGQFKEITAGDPMKAEEKFKDPFHFEPTAKHMFSANQLPDTETDDEAFYRRVLLCAFPTTIPRGERDPKLDDKLQSELAGVLNWALEGLQRLLTQGRFTGDRTPGQTQDTWEKWGNSISRFESVGFEDAPDEVVPKKKAYRAYVAYCEDEGIPTETQHKFTRYLKSEGVEDDRAYVDGDRQRVYTGVQLTGRAEGLLQGDSSGDTSDSGGRERSGSVTDY